jgi:hypothetical protein
MYGSILAYLPIPGGEPIYFEEEEPIKYKEFKEKLKDKELAFC